MIPKETLHLGQEVLVGDRRERAVVDGLSQTFAGVIVNGGPLMIVAYEKIFLP